MHINALKIYIMLFAVWLKICRWLFLFDFIFWFWEGSWQLLFVELMIIYVNFGKQLIRYFQYIQNYKHYYLMAKSQPTVIAIGKNKGHKTTKIQAKRARPVSTKAKLGKRTKLVRQIISQVSGVSGYEKRVIQFLKAGSLKDTKRALKATKKALGTHRRAKLKRENLMNILRAQQAKKK